MCRYIAHVLAEYNYASGVTEEAVLYLRASELEEALKELKNSIVGTPNEYCEFEPDINFAVEKATVYEVSEKTEAPLVQWLLEKEVIETNYKKNLRRLKRRKKYDELKAEFESEC